MRLLPTLAIAALLLPLAACRIQDDKDASGHDKKVAIDTPFGGMHLSTNQTTAVDTGLSAYPGAQSALETANDNKSADVHLGFGQWQLHIRIAKYTSTDPREKVLAFYRKDLSRFGTVIECKAGQPVGTPVQTSDGLSCKEDADGHKLQVNGHKLSTGSHELRAGSHHHQHIVGIEDGDDQLTHFSLVSVDLPVSGSSKAD